MVNQPNLSIPENLTPDTRCLCLQIPDDPTWIQNFVGLLAVPRYWFNWDRDEARSGKILANYWSELFDQIDWSTMSCCCDNPPAIFRYNSSGVYQRSTDGGATWTDAPGFDYRNTSTTWPPPSALGIDNGQCQAADGVVYTIKTKIIADMDSSSSAADILAIIAAVLFSILSAGSLAAFTPLIAAIGAAIVNFGVDATKAALTDAVWNRLRCNVFCHMNTSSSIDATGFAGVLAQLATDESGIALIVLQNIINAAGVVGVTNMLRSNTGDPDADCSCGCGDCTNLADWGILTFDSIACGTIISRGDNYIIVGGVFHPDFGGVADLAILTTPDSMSCCKITNFETISGDGSDYHLFYVGCGDTQWPAGTWISWPTPTTAPSSSQLFIRKDTGSNFQVKITFAEP